MRPRLRLYTGHCDESVLQQPQVTMRLGEMAVMLDDARRHNRTWLQDFEQEEVQVPADLFEVMTAYWQLRDSA